MISTGFPVRGYPPRSKRIVQIREDVLFVLCVSLFYQHFLEVPQGVAITPPVLRKRFFRPKRIPKMLGKRLSAHRMNNCLVPLSRRFLSVSLRFRNPFLKLFSMFLCFFRVPNILIPLFEDGLCSLLEDFLRADRCAVKISCYFIGVFASNSQHNEVGDLQGRRLISQINKIP